MAVERADKITISTDVSMVYIYDFSFRHLTSNQGSNDCRRGPDDLV